MQRRRFATRQELVELLAGGTPGIVIATVDAALQALAEQGADVEALVKIVVDEEI